MKPYEEITICKYMNSTIFVPIFILFKRHDIINIFKPKKQLQFGSYKYQKYKYYEPNIFLKRDNFIKTNNK